MKTLKNIYLSTLAGCIAFNGFTQSLQLPAPSPAASVSQTFGLTKIDISYSSPGVKGREGKIWGSLVPYDSVWRTGANGATTINFNTDVMIGGQKVKQGKYALFTIPGRNTWTVILNTDAGQFGAFDYKKTMDVARITVIPQPADFKERMAFMIDPVSDSVAVVWLCWEKLKIGFNITADTKSMIKKNISDFTDNNWRTYANAANYYVDNSMDLTKAHDWAQASVTMKEHFYNRFVMAKVLKAEGNGKEGLNYAMEAKKIGEKANDEFYNAYKERVEKLITELSNMPMKKM